MPIAYQIPYTADRFPSRYPVSGTLDVTGADLAHALFTTGRAPGDQYHFGLASHYEFIHRTSLVPAYLRRDPHGLIVKSRLAEDLDRSEKVALSYTLGQATTAIFANQVVQTPLLLHVDRYARQYDVRFLPTRRRPDLIGLNWTGNWIVAEAKGRSRAVPQRLLDDLGDQKRAVRTINRSRPALAFGCAAGFQRHLGRNRPQLCVNAIDPEDEYPRAADWDEVTHDEYVLAYYEPFIALLDAGPTRRQGSYYTVNLAAPGVRVGLLHPLVREIRRSARRTRPEGLFAAVKEIVGEWEEVSLPVAGKNFPDGSTFHTRWDLEEVEGD